MIRRNDTVEQEDDAQNRQKLKRDFTRVARAAIPCWHEIERERGDQRARGFIFAAGRAITANLFFNRRGKRVALVIRFRMDSGLSPSQKDSVERVQSETEGLSSIAFDEDNHILRISSQSVLPAAVLADAVVPEIFADTVALLRNDNLRDIVGQSASY